MTDPKQELKKLFSRETRYTNFGEIISKAKIKGFRGINDLEISFDYPITAISGLNGSGKSTVAQLMMSAYKSLSTEPEYKRHYISNYFPVSKADPEPFSDDASIEYFYCTLQTDRLKELTVKRGNKQWGGYKRQPERHCQYIGFTIYIPKVEQRDISIYRGNDISIQNELPLPEEAKKAIRKILSSPYSDLTSATAKHDTRTVDIGFAKKFNAKYSENNMGFGEGRVFYTVRSLEAAPEKSLFVIEEPETSLHENAQYELAKYFIDVCFRRKHQIIITTHSRAILSALPVESRKLLYRNEKGVEISNRISTVEATGVLSLGNNHDLILIIEDRRAEKLLTEIIRVADNKLLKGIKTICAGNDDMVVKLTKECSRQKIKVKAFLDGDSTRQGNQKEPIRSLPGKKICPEKEVFFNGEVQKFLSEKYNFNFKDWLLCNDNIDFHDWPKEISKELTKSADDLWDQVCEVYAKSLNDKTLKEIVDFIKN